MLLFLGIMASFSKFRRQQGSKFKLALSRIPLFTSLPFPQSSVYFQQWHVVLLLLPLKLSSLVQQNTANEASSSMIRGSRRMGPAFVGSITMAELSSILDHTVDVNNRNSNLTYNLSPQLVKHHHRHHHQGPSCLV